MPTIEKKMNPFHYIFLFLIFSVPGNVFANDLNPKKALKASKARHWISHYKTICDTVKEVKEHEKGYFINLGGEYKTNSAGKTYLKPDFTAIIWKNSFKDILEPNQEFLNKKVCFHGKIKAFYPRYSKTRSIPQIIIKEKNQYFIPAK